MFLQKVISKKTFLTNLFFVGILKVNDENGRIRIQDLDPLIIGMDPRILIRVHTKILHCKNRTDFLQKKRTLLSGR
jgi:hypothetical protein